MAKGGWFCSEPQAAHLQKGRTSGNGEGRKRTKWTFSVHSQQTAVVWGPSVPPTSARVCELLGLGPKLARTGAQAVSPLPRELLSWVGEGYKPPLPPWGVEPREPRGRVTVQMASPELLDPAPPEAVSQPRLFFQGFTAHKASKYSSPAHRPCWRLGKATLPAGPLGHRGQRQDSIQSGQGAGGTARM